jgi:predicted oxidoreductase
VEAPAGSSGSGSGGGSGGWRWRQQEGMLEVAAAAVAVPSGGIKGRGVEWRRQWLDSTAMGMHPALVWCMCALGPGCGMTGCYMISFCKGGGTTWHMMSGMVLIWY